MQSADRQSILVLTKKLAMVNVPKDVFGQLTAYILYPVVTAARNTAAGMHADHIITCIKCVLDRILTLSLDIAKELISVFAVLGYDRRDTIARSEELRLDIVNCLLLVIQKSPIQLSKETLPLFAHAISMLLDFLSSKPYLELTKISLDAITKIISIASATEIAAIMPGIISVLSKILSAGDKLAHITITKCIKAARMTISGCYTDEILTSHENINPISVEDISKEWSRNCLIHLDIFIPIVLNFRSHSNEMVRTETLLFASCFLSAAFNSLQTSISNIAETVVYLSMDFVSSINIEAKSVLSKMEEKETFKDILFAGLSNRLAGSLKLFKRANDEGKCNELILLCGYFHAMQDRATICLNVHLTIFVNSLLYLLTPSFQSTKFVVERSLHECVDGGLVPDFSIPKREFQHFQSNRVYDSLKVLCASISAYNTNRLLVNFVTSLLGTPQSAQCMLLLNLLMSEEKSQNDWILEALNEYLYLNESLPATNIIDARYEGIYDKSVILPSLLRMNEGVVSRTIMMESISHAATVLSADQISEFLIEGLYPILEAFGNVNIAVHESAYMALRSLAVNYLQSETSANQLVSLENSEHSISNLIMFHVDYLIDYISHRLKCVKLNPMAPKVLVAAIRATGSAIVGPLMTDCVDLVIDLLDEFGTTGFISGIGSTINGDDGDAGIVGELINVFFALMKVMFDAITGDDIAAHLVSGANLEIDLDEYDHMKEVLAGASPEISKFYLRNYRKPQIEDDKEKDLSAQEFFTDRLDNPGFEKDKGDDFEESDTPKFDGIHTYNIRK